MASLRLVDLRHLLAKVATLTGEPVVTPLTPKGDEPGANWGRVRKGSWSRCPTSKMAETGDDHGEGEEGARSAQGAKRRLEGSE